MSALSFSRLARTSVAVPFIGGMRSSLTSAAWMIAPNFSSCDLGDDDHQA